jgi:primosomal protein N' (replication factor Y) (superfamily II helicase)
MQILDVLIQHAKTSLNRPFSYIYKGDGVKKGVRVLVPFNGQSILAYVVGARETNLSKEELEKANGFRFEEIRALIDKEPLLNEELMKLCDEVSSYYLAPKISVLQAMLPSSLKPALSALKGPKIAYDYYFRAIDINEDGLTAKQKEALRLIADAGEVLKKEAGSPSIARALLEKGKIEVFRKERERFHIPEYEREQPHELNIEQQKAFDYILSDEHAVILLQGVTGSGKTEVYLHLAEEYLKQGKTILMLVPEISLTPAMVEYFSRRFGNEIAILHSELTPAEKYDEYRRIACKKARVVVGARSAIFAPLENIGLIILDEEHTETYKQDTLPYYHAREVAIMRAAHFGAKVLLGSATPNLETKARAMKGVYGYAKMEKRANAKPLPETKIIDLTKRNLMMPGDRLFSKELFDAIKDRLSKKEQVVLLLNRRGYSSYVTCSHCGYIFTCPNCHGNLTYHKFDNMLKCHHCDFVMEYPEICPECGSGEIMRVGFGTERVAKILHEDYKLPARIARLDSDIGKVRNNISKVLREFSEKKYDILVGTQMIAKGHDFPDVTLVGLVLADVGLSLPTYRAAERTFQLITQAVGRSGRGDKTGQALIQTYNPNHYAVTLGAKQDYESFYLKEMQSRKTSLYPPYRYLFLLKFSCKNEERCIESSFDVKRHFDAMGFASSLCLGPLSPFFALVNGLYQRSLLIKTKYPDEVRKYLADILSNLSGKGGVDIVCDVDPIDY